MRRLQNTLLRAGCLATLIVLLASASAYARTWTDSQGRKINGTFVRVFQGNVVLKVGTRTITVPFDNLSAEDQEYLRKDLEAKGKGDLLPPPGASGRVGGTQGKGVGLSPNPADRDEDRTRAAMGASGRPGPGQVPARTGGSMPSGYPGASAPSGYPGGSRPGYAGAATPSGYPGGAAPSGYPGGSAPPGYSGGATPSGYPGASAPSGYPGGSTPSGYPGASAPSGYPGGSTPSGYPGGSAPSGYPGGSAPSGYPGSSGSGPMSSPSGGAMPWAEGPAPAPPLGTPGPSIPIPTGPQMVEVKVCLNCKKEVPASTKAGDRCPHCGVYFAYEQNRDGSKTYTPGARLGFGLFGGAIAGGAIAAVIAILVKVLKGSS